MTLELHVSINPSSSATMASSLTPRQAEELHKAIIAYLSSNNLSQAAASLQTELNLGETLPDDGWVKKYDKLLERKWTSVVRLQKKIMDLESRITALQAEVDSAAPTSLLRRTQDPSTWLPRGPPRHTLESHRDTINCLAFHPVFSSIASGSDDCTIKVWDWELGELEKTIKGHTRAVLDVDYGGPRGGTLLASCGSDLTIKLWDPSNQYQNVRNLQGHDHSVSAVRFIPSGAAGAPASGNLLVSASRDKTLRVWDVTTGYCVRTIPGHSGWVRDVFPSPDGSHLLSVGDDRTVQLWNIAGLTPEKKFSALGHEHIVECCAIAPAAAYTHLSQLAGLGKPPPASSTAEFMATGSRDKTIRLWDAHGSCFKRLVGHDNWIRALVFHPGGRYLFSVSDDRTLRCWDLSQEGKCVKILADEHERFITCLEWAPGVWKQAPSQANGAHVSKPSQGSDGLTIQLRCVIATGGVDQKLRIFAD